MKNILSAVDSVLSRIINEKAVVEFHGIFPNGFILVNVYDSVNHYL